MYNCKINKKMENKIKQIIKNNGELILVCSVKSHIFERRDFSGISLKEGDTLEISEKGIHINGNLLVNKHHEPVKKGELERMYSELPEIFQHRINMLRYNVPDFDIFYAKEEIENCYAAYQQSLKPWIIHFDENDLPQFWLGEPTIIDKLCMAYRFKDHDNFLEDELMMLDQGKNLAMPRTVCIQKYMDYLAKK